MAGEVLAAISVAAISGCVVGCVIMLPVMRRAQRLGERIGEDRVLRIVQPFSRFSGDERS